MRDSNFLHLWICVMHTCYKDSSPQSKRLFNMSKFNVGTLQPICCRRASLKCITMSIFGAVCMVIFFDHFQTKENIANYTYYNYKYKPNYKHVNRIVSESSSVVGSQEWMRNKEIELEARRTQVREDSSTGSLCKTQLQGSLESNRYREAHVV